MASGFGSMVCIANIWLSWERELEGVMTDKQQNLRRENVELKKENKKLKKEQKRDKAAMAEALALLTLKKKVDAYLDQEEEDS